MIRHCWIEVVPGFVFSGDVDLTHVDLEDSGFVLVGVKLENKNNGRCVDVFAGEFWWW